METISKHIGEGFGKGELYAALAYDSGDSFGGMAIKQVRFNPASDTTAITIGDSTTELSYTAGTPLFVMYATTTNTTSTNAEPFYVKSTLTGTGGYGGRSRFHTYANVTVGGNNMPLKSHMEFGDSGKLSSGLATGFCAELVMPNANTGTAGAYCVLELEYVAGGSSLVTAGNLSGNHASFIRATNSGDADGDFDDHGFLMSFQGLNDATGHVLYHNTLKMAVGTTTWYLPLSSAEGNYTTVYQIVCNYAAGTISGEVHGLAVSMTGTLSSGDGMVAGNFIATTSGTAAAWVSGIYAKVVQGASKNVSGYISGAEFEVISSVTVDVSDWFVLVLNANSKCNGQHSAYIALRNYGTTALNQLLWIEDQTIGSDNDETSLVAANNPTAATHTIRIMVDDTPYYLMVCNAGGLTS